MKGSLQVRQKRVLETRHGWSSCSQVASSTWVRLEEPATDQCHYPNQGENHEDDEDPEGHADIFGSYDCIHQALAFSFEKRALSAVWEPVVPRRSSYFASSS